MKKIIKGFFGKTPKLVKTVRNIALVISAVAAAVLNIEGMEFIEPIATKAISISGALVAFLAQFFSEGNDD